MYFILYFSVQSFVALTKELLQEEGVEYVLSERFNQDPIEEYFSKQRGLGGGSDNPSVLEFNRRALRIQLAGAAVRASLSGNCTNIERY